VCDRNLTYVPPEKKKKGGTSGFGDIVYVILFYLMEGLFIFVGIPIIIFAIGIIPVAMYLVITGERSQVWPLYIFGVAIVFFEILGLQYFIRRYILKPHNMTLGQWLRWKFSPAEIRKRREEKREKTRRMEEWYGGMERVHMTKERIKEEQAYDLRSEWFKGEDPELSVAGAEAETISFGDFADQTTEQSAEPLATKIITGEEQRADSEDSVAVKFGTFEEEEEKEKSEEF
jgi:hypothetical protein